MKIMTLALFCCLLARAAGEEGTVAGWVTRCNGNWEDRTDARRPVKLACKGSRADELWLPILRESKLFLTSHNAGQWIDLRIARTGEKHHFDCDKPGECDPPPLPFARFVPPEESAGILQGFLRSPGREYARVRLLLSRSENDESARVTVDHAVVAQDAPIPLREMIRPNVPAGEYLLEVCAFDERNGCPSTSKPTLVKWSPDSTAAWPNPVTAGLYEVVLSRVVSGITIRTPDRGMLLVWQQGAAAVRDAVRAAEQLFLKDWKDPSEGRLMFQAFLMNSAQQPGK